MTGNGFSSDSAINRRRNSALNEFPSDTVRFDRLSLSAFIDEGIREMRENCACRFRRVFLDGNALILSLEK
jgi:hypothetical protein